MQSRAPAPLPEAVARAIAAMRRRSARALAVVRDAARDAAATMVPVDCPACAAPGIGLCGACCSALRAAVDPMAGGLLVGETRVPLAAAVEYDGVARELIGALKERGRLDAVAPLAALTRIALTAALNASRAQHESHPSHTPHHSPVPHPTRPRDQPHPSLVIVPAPSRPASTRQRGYVPIELVCQAALPRGAVVPLLAMGAATRDQAGLGRDDRAANLVGAIRAFSAAGANVVLVDDVVTTGATVTEACRALTAAGARVVAVALIARAVRRDGAFPAWAGAM